ncbi:hypothetical protein EFL81_01770 [Weissella confusa]|uniref:hypothetical protein n=1 Tax=Weissella confusa TaxID=1583 RepID=UPI00223B018D|nr:hypothetical protein [Weissella confusa]MCS9995627.1 hypothetical protein [Weissella confusa]
MKIKERIYPYPVIKEPEADYTDYQQATFNFSVQVVDSGVSGYKLIVDINDESVPDKLLPERGITKVKYGVQVESLMNKYRTFISSDAPHFEMELDGANYIGRVEINAYIYATEHINVSFDNNVDGNAAFYDGVVSFPKGAIIAVSRPTKQIIIKSDGLNRENPVRIVRDDNVEGVRYDVNNSNIEIRLNKENHDIYSRYAKDPMMKQFVTNAIVVPAVARAVSALAEGEVDEDSDWGEFFVNKFAENGIDLSDVGEQVSLEEATEILLNNPTDKMFKKLQEYGDNGTRR